VADEKERVEVHFRGTSETPITFSNFVSVQTSEHDALITFYQIRPNPKSPMLLGDPLLTDRTLLDCVATIAMTPFQAKELLKLLRAQCEKQEWGNEKSE